MQAACPERVWAWNALSGYGKFRKVEGLEPTDPGAFLIAQADGDTLDLTVRWLVDVRPVALHFPSKTMFEVSHPGICTYVVSGRAMEANGLAEGDYPDPESRLGAAVIRLARSFAQLNDEHVKAVS